MARDEFDEILAEMANAVTSIFGYAELLAGRHMPDVAEDINRARVRYMNLEERLRRIHRRDTRARCDAAEQGGGDGGTAGAGVVGGAYRPESTIPPA